VMDQYRQRGVQLAQVLLEPIESPMLGFYQSVSFQIMAELIYLQATPKRGTMPPSLPSKDYSWKIYSTQTHAQFGATIAATYEQSLDCPALNGMRDMDDVIEGHKAAGVFEEGLWFLLCRNDMAHGVLLLTRTPHTDALELVYLGLVPAA